MEPHQLDRILKQHVQTDALLGVKSVPAGDVIAVPFESSHSSALEAAHAASVSTPTKVPPPPATLHPTPARRSTVSAARSIPTPAAQLQRSTAAVKLKPMDRDTKLRVLQEMDANEVRGCTRCELSRGRTQTVFGEGDPEAAIMFIGEGPGYNEDVQGRPFVGRGGELLEKMIVAMGYAREQVYIANVVKCRPPNNRTPTPGEVDACSDYLKRQILTVQPQVIVTLGGPAAKMILNTKEGVTRLRGTWHQYNGVNPPIPVMPTFHPAYLLRSYTKENRARVWSDLQQVMEKVHSP